MNPRSLKFIIRSAQFPVDLELVRRLFCDYQADIQMDLCFQRFKQELARLRGRYVNILIAEPEDETVV